MMISLFPPTPCILLQPPLGQSQEVFSHMAGDFMRNVIDIVDDLLKANVNVTVYNGQLDLIVSTIGKDMSW